MIKNLIFKGGGVLGIAYAGSIFELQNREVMKNIERVAGTSAGAITATLVALKYTASEIKDIIDKTDFAAFEDGNVFEYADIFTKYGIHPGNTFLTWMQNKIARKGLPINATFADLQKAGCLDLHVFATNLNTNNLKRFSFAETPNVRVCEAVRASMSIPLFFHAWKFDSDSHIYVDGGTIYNYPITVFDTEQENPETLGLFLANLNGAEVDNGLAFDQIGKYVKSLAESAMDSQEIDLLADASDMKRTVLIDNCGISAINFKINDEQKAKLFQAGKDAVIKYFESQIADGETA